MNNIQKALEMQEIYVAWAGSEPDTVNRISKAYLEDTVDGFPRMVRSDIDKGNSIVLKTLKADYTNVLKEVDEVQRTETINTDCRRIIFSNASLIDQTNLAARYAMLNSTAKLTKEKKDELASILKVWEWIDDMRSTAKKSKSGLISADHIKWPKFPK